MKDRGKALETYNGNCFSDSYYSSSSDLPCRKHPSTSTVGICAHCLKDRLIKLVCSDCGEQRLSSCSCSEISSNRNSCTVEVGSVGRISFLIENEKTDLPHAGSKAKSTTEDKAEEVILLRRSSSSSVDVKINGFWRIGRIFGKKRDKGFENSGKSVEDCDDKNEMWLVDYMGVSRSRSLCSFRGGGLNDLEEGCDQLNVSAARSSSVTGGLSEVEPRKSGFDCEKRSDVADAEMGSFDVRGMRKGNVNGAVGVGTGLKGANRRFFSLKESDFNGIDDSSFIDLKFDSSSESKPALSAFKTSSFFNSSSGFSSMRGDDIMEEHDCGGSCGDGVFTRGGSCRITVNDRGIKKSKKSMKVWRWIFRHHPNRGSARKKDEDHYLKP